MATATCQLSEDQFLCSICLDVFTDPVTLPCGHNFCKDCIHQHMSNTLGCTCPFCKESFSTRPELKINTFISEIAALFRQSAKQEASSELQQLTAPSPEEVPCDVCTDPKQTALKSCLVCLSSYCESHLEPHLNMSGLRRHQLIEPQGNLEERLCTEHDKPLELFCEDDKLCVCVLCMYSGHKNHEVVPLKDAFEEQKQQLGMVKSQVQGMIRTRKQKIRALHCSLELNNKNAERELADGVEIFTALKESVERGLDNLITEITKKKTDIEDQAKGFIGELEQEILQLRKRGSEVKEVFRSDDHLHLLQNFLHLSSVSPTKDWTDISVLPRYEGIVARAVAQLEEDFNRKTKSLFEAELKRVKRFQQDVTLDHETAHPNLLLSRNCKEVTHMEKRNYPYSSKRFDGLFVLGSQSFSESFYFEAVVRGKPEWTLGVAKKSVNRKGAITQDPQNGFWTIGLMDKAYYASPDTDNCLVTKCKPEKVGVFVDYKQGIVSFYDVEAPALIYSLTGLSFNEKLHPICGPGHCRGGNSDPMVILGKCK